MTYIKASSNEFVQRTVHLIITCCLIVSSSLCSCRASWSSCSACMTGTVADVMGTSNKAPDL